MSKTGNIHGLTPHVQETTAQCGQGLTTAGGNAVGKSREGMELLFYKSGQEGLPGKVTSEHRDLP